MPVWKNPRTVLITGATGGIGSALAESYATDGRVLILHGRDRGRLAELSHRCEAAGGRVVTLTFDLRDAEAAVRELRHISQTEPIDLAIANAGITRVIRAVEQIESWEADRDVHPKVIVRPRRGDLPSSRTTYPGGRSSDWS